MNLLSSSLEMLQHELLLFGAIWLLIGAIDDLSIDGIWLVRRAYRRLVFYRARPPMTADDLPPPVRPGLLAIFVPTWAEANVIGAMLGRCDENWRSGKCDYRIYVGCYPNDHQGCAVVAAAADRDPRVRMVTLAENGPSTKAGCLKNIWKALLADELTGGFKAKAIILHDAEDAVHPRELIIFDRLIEKCSAVQLPVIPIRAAKSRWISGHYCDEFAEAHGKTMVVREAIGAALPLAGVGCAIDRNLLGRIALDNDGKPFDGESLTEDYELGLRIGAFGGRTIMARIVDADGNLVGTRAYFPATLDESVRQKTRWLTGIALAGWDRIGWRGSLVDRWMLLHDRRSILAAVVMIVAYACILLTALLAILSVSEVYQPSPLPALLVTVLTINAGFLVWRLAVRAAFVGAVYGPAEALLSIPRSIIANVIAIMAARRACAIYVRHCFGAPLVWDKTKHYIIPETSSPRE